MFLYFSPFPHIFNFISEHVKKLAFLAIYGFFFYMYKYTFLKKEKPAMDDFEKKTLVLKKKYFHTFNIILKYIEKCLHQIYDDT